MEPIFACDERTVMPLMERGRAENRAVMEVTTYADAVDNESLRRFSGIVWLAASQERFSLVAPTWDDAVALLKEQYGHDREFVLTDEEAANRPR